MRRLRQSRRGAVSLRNRYGIGNMDADTYLSTADPSGIGGDAGGFYVGVIFKLSTLRTNDYIMNTQDGSGGYKFVVSSGDVQFACMSGASADTYSPGGSVTANTLHCAVGVHDGTKVRLYLDGVQAADGTAITGYTARTGTAYVGGGGGSDGFLSFFGALYGVGVPTAQNIADWNTLCRSSRQLADMPGVAASSIFRTTSAGGAPAGLSLGGTGHTLAVSRS